MKWYKKNLDIRIGFGEQRYDDILEYAEKNSKLLIGAMDDNDKDFDMSLKYGNSILKQFEAKFIHTGMAKAIFAIGQLKGVIRACAHLDYERKTDDRIWRDTKQLYSSIKHLDRIIEQIDKQNGVSHAILAEELGMKPSTLTECMKRMSETNLIRDKRSGKYKIYVLSDDGKRYAMELKQKQKSIEVNGDRLLSYISKIQSNNHKYVVIDRSNPSRVKFDRNSIKKDLYSLDNVLVSESSNSKENIFVFKNYNEMKDGSNKEYGERTKCKQLLMNY